MKLIEKICARKFAYLLTPEPAIAFELALYYFIQAKRKNTDKKIADTCLKSLYWLNVAAIDVPDQIRQLCPTEQLIEIERILVGSKSRCFDRDKAILAAAAVGARHPALAYASGGILG